MKTWIVWLGFKGINIVMDIRYILDRRLSSFIPNSSSIINSSTIK